jgi:hypothetical protein
MQTSGPARDLSKCMYGDVLVRADYKIEHFIGYDNANSYTPVKTMSGQAYGRDGWHPRDNPDSYIVAVVSPLEICSVTPDSWQALQGKSYWLIYNARLQEWTADLNRQAAQGIVPARALSPVQTNFLDLTKCKKGDLLMKRTGVYVRYASLNNQASAQYKCWVENEQGDGLNSYTLAGRHWADRLSSHDIVQIQSAPSPEPEPQKDEDADMDGWIAHKPGDPCPCDPDMPVTVKHASGIVQNLVTATTWPWYRKEADVVAWRPSAKPRDTVRKETNPNDTKSCDSFDLAKLDVIAYLGSIQQPKSGAPYLNPRYLEPIYRVRGQDIVLAPPGRVEGPDLMSFRRISFAELQEHVACGRCTSLKLGLPAKEDYRLWVNDEGRVMYTPAADAKTAMAEIYDRHMQLALGVIGTDYKLEKAYTHLTVARSANPDILDPMVLQCAIAETIGDRELAEHVQRLATEKLVSEGYFRQLVSTEKDDMRRRRVDLPRLVKVAATCTHLDALEAACNAATKEELLAAADWLFCDSNQVSVALERIAELRLNPVPAVPK